MTEIAPGMMVECIDNCAKISGPSSLLKAIPQLKIKSFYIVKSCNVHPELNQPTICLEGKPSFGETYLSSEGYAIHWGYSLNRFRPIGGDKEIEQQESKRTGKSAKDNIKNKELTNDYKFFIIDMDDK